MFDIKKQIYNCEFYKQTVFVHIKREICDEGEYCLKPQPHITREDFHNCSDILNCGVGKVESGTFIAPNIHLCPAHFKLHISGEKL